LATKIIIVIEIKVLIMNDNNYNNEHNNYNNNYTGNGNDNENNFVVKFSSNY